jgi:hypothetical protein
MTTEEHQAQALERWLESPPGTPPPEGLDPDVVEAILALRPDRIPTARVTAEEILGAIQTGPLMSPHAQANRPHASWRARWAYGGVAAVLAAAVVGVLILPNLAPMAEAPPDLGVSERLQVAAPVEDLHDEPQLREDAESSPHTPSPRSAPAPAPAPQRSGRGASPTADVPPARATADAAPSQPAVASPPPAVSTASSSDSAPGASAPVVASPPAPSAAAAAPEPARAAEAEAVFGRAAKRERQERSVQTEAVPDRDSFSAEEVESHADELASSTADPERAARPPGAPSPPAKPAHDAHQRGEYSVAIELADAALASATLLPVARADVLWVKGLALRAQGRRADADACFREAAALRGR